MTRRLRDADRERILSAAARTIAALASTPGGIKALRRAVDESRDGLRGTDYDALRGGGGGDSPTERAALHGHGLDLDAALLRLEQVADDLAQAAVFSPAPPPRPGKRRPGQGPCPAGKCRDHWEAGIELAAAKRRYTEFCRRCGDHRNDHGSSIPPLVLQAVHAAGGDWQHWSVGRAWDSCGGRPAANAPKDPRPEDAT